MISRRQLLKGAAALGFTGFGLGGYAMAIEPYRIAVRRYRLSPPGWANGPKLRVVAIADIHMNEPWMPVSRLEPIVARVNQLKPDVVVMLGDFVAGHRFVRRSVPHDQWAETLAKLEAPLGRFAILGNHDWWERYEWQVTRKGPTLVGEALQRAGIPVLENDSIRLERDGKPFWISGLGDQWAFWLTEIRRNRQGSRSLMPDNTFGFDGRDDLPKAIAGLTDDAPAILLAHEPDIFPRVPSRYALTMSGHTHGGQVQLFGWAPRVPSIYGSRYLYGHIVEGDSFGNRRDLIVSGGIGCSGIPVRFGRPPEIVVADLSPPSEETAA